MRLWDLPTMVACLRLPAGSDSLLQRLALDSLDVERSGHYGFAEFREVGVSVVFKQAPWVLPAAEVRDPDELRLVAFHLHGQGHDGYEEYSGALPGDVFFGESRERVLLKLGAPNASGGGGISAVLGTQLPLWVRYDKVNYSLQVQFNAVGDAEMLTVFVPDVPLAGQPSDQGQP